MCKYSFFPLLITLAALLSACASPAPDPPEPPDQDPANSQLQTNLQIIPLPEPDLQGTLTLEQTLVQRRSVRQFQNSTLTDAQIGQLLWAAQGVTHPSGLRTAPSAGALYPLEIYAATQDGLFRYQPEDHSLERVLDYDPRPDLCQAALGQDSVRDAPLVIIITAVFSRTAQRYGDARTPQYVYLEAGHAAQNIHLQAVALELGSVPIGAFHDDQVSEVMSLPADETPLYLIPVGYPK
jgi:SagB-type dehydrogenase family enzyme